MAMGRSFNMMSRGHLTKSAPSVLEHPSKNGKVNPNLVWDERSEREMNDAVPGGAFLPTGPQNTYEDISEATSSDDVFKVEKKPGDTKEPWKPRTASDAYDASMETVEKKPWKPKS